VNEKT